ncbi:hypothetical protein [Actinomadura hibisca]|uniref:hypothetical protein n=1 Tax=Actinomadura hibisca TaxID=68565 RepID=UPI00082C18E5|nr:hypothetical protein [Actinomadura hibisca]
MSAHGQVEDGHEPARKDGGPDGFGAAGNGDGPAGFEALPVTVHQAAGMMSVQLAASLADAYRVLFARAAASGVPVEEVAGQVLGRRLRLGPADVAQADRPRTQPDD